MHKRWLLSLAALLATGSVMAQEGGPALPHSGTDIKDIESLQRGARNFMNYCSGCHSLKYVRYNRIGRDLNIPDSALAANLMFTATNAFDTVNSSMPATDAESWFGKAPPDLSLMARARSPDYIYAFLKSFYNDKTRPWGTNNLILPGAAMPDVLADLQGTQQPVFVKEKDKDGNDLMVLTSVEALTPGAMKPEEFDKFVRDTTNFLDYAAEPAKAKRQSLGVFITLFLLVGFAFAYFLKKEYWKDVH